MENGQHGDQIKAEDRALQSQKHYNRREFLSTIKEPMNDS